MKLYQSEKTGSIYWIDKDNYLCFAPMLADNGIIDLNNDGGVLDYDVIEEEDKQYIKEIERELKEEEIYNQN